MVDFEMMTYEMLKRFDAVRRGRDKAALRGVGLKLDALMKSLGDVQPACVMLLRDELRKVNVNAGLLKECEAYCSVFDDVVVLRNLERRGVRNAVVEARVREGLESLRR